MLIAEAFEPNFGLFSSTKLNSFYPSATSSVHGRNYIQIFEFIGKVNIIVYMYDPNYAINLGLLVGHRQSII